MDAGARLRALREQRGMSQRDVEAAANRIAAKYNNPDFALPASRLSDVEAKGSIPSLFRLYTLAAIYRLDIRELFSIFGVNLENLPEDTALPPQRVTYPVSGTVERAISIPLPDIGLDPRRTQKLQRMIQDWGTLPLSYLERLQSKRFVYAVVGAEDFTMYPLIQPGAFLQIDPSKSKIAERGWRSEHERPVYFLETRAGYICAWCTKSGGTLIIHPHPLSQVRGWVLRYPDDVEVVGQVVGLATRLGSALRVEHEQSSTEHLTRDLNARERVL